jgi:hypothetical protein
MRQHLASKLETEFSDKTVRDRKTLHTIKSKFIIKNSNFIKYYINYFLYLPLTVSLYVYYLKKKSLFKFKLSPLLSSCMI